ncbi:MAG: polyprenyl synthetase family protein [Ardenticatenales bacterium]
MNGDVAVGVDRDRADVATASVDPLLGVRAEIEHLERYLTDDRGIEYPLVAELLRFVFSGGGKRLRPALVFLVARLGGAEAHAVLSLAAAVETLHTATLVHDDLVDGAMLRRGLPALNVRWSPGATVLAGDWLFARAAGFAADTNDVRVQHIFARTLATITAGELRQLFGRRGVPTQSEYTARIYGKTASLFEAATEAMAVLNDMPEPQLAALAAYGRLVGTAFQIVDDILDFTGNPDRIGKPVGNDLRSGQVTLPAMLHLDAHPTAAPWLTAPGGADADPAVVAALVDAVRADRAAITGAHAAARAAVAEAVDHLAALPASAARDDLARVADYAVARDL